jgi:diacylglycerol kinase
MAQKLEGFWHHQITSFHHALDGLFYNFKTQSHFRAHIVIALTIILAGFIYKLNTFERIIIIVLIGLTIAAEAMNTAIEETCNLLHPEIHPHARIAKHCAAGAVLAVSITSAIVGIIIFLPKIIS